MRGYTDGSFENANMIMLPPCLRSSIPCHCAHDEHKIVSMAYKALHDLAAVCPSVKPNGKGPIE